MQNDVGKSVFVGLGQPRNGLVEGRVGLVSVGAAGGIDKVLPQARRQQRLLEVFEERLQAAADHVDVVDVRLEKTTTLITNNPINSPAARCKTYSHPLNRILLTRLGTAFPL